MSVPDLKIRRIDTRSDDVDALVGKLREQLSPRGNVVSERGRQKTIEVFGEPLSPVEVVARICEDVRNDGIDAVLRYSLSLDGADLDASKLRVAAEELQSSHQAADPAFLETIRRIRDNIIKFQTAILHKDVQVDCEDGVRLGQRYLPVARAGLCVPGGAAAYPSTVLMTAVPAQVAGVRQLAVVAPPTRFGSYNADLLATCHELGIEEVYRVGGAQAVAALAMGVDGIPAVDKIVGPGNLFVALAKKQVYGEVDIDAIAGPSEVVVIADESTNPAFTAADLLAQAEHAPGASILITWSEDMLNATAAELQRQVQQLSRCEMAVQSLEDFGALILVRDQPEACAITNEIAPEHLHIAIDDPAPLLDQIHNVGASFLGNYSPIAVGDYAAGPSHVLPTGGTSRWASGLSANSFLRSSSIIAFTEKGLKRIAPDVQRMADKEMLTAHRASVDIRVTNNQ
jgi:histidinol dehydrogenase